MATRYLVTGGGSVVWTAVDTSIWSATSGGATGASVPGVGDDVIMDGSSGGGTVTLGYSPTVNSITMGAFTGTFSVSTYSPTMATFNCSGTGTRTLNMGSGTWTLTGSNATIFTVSTTTNLTMNFDTATVDCTYSGGTGTRTFILGSAASSTLGQVYRLKVSAGTDTFNLTASGSVNIRDDLDFTGFAGTLTTGTSFYYGNVTLSSGMTWGTSSTSVISFVATSAKTFDPKGKTIDQPVTFDGVGGSWQLLSAFTVGSSRTVTLTRGTLDTNGQTCSWGLFSSSNSNTRVLTLGASAITITGTGTVWNTATTTNLTFNRGTSSIRLSYSSTTTFEGGGLTYYDVRFDYLMGIGLTINGNNTFNNLQFIGTTGSTTNQIGPIVSGNWTVNGTFTATGLSNVIRIGFISSVTGTTRTITAAAVSLSNCDFMDITGAGAAAPFTGTSLGDMGGNSGITFTTPVTRYAVAAGNWSSTGTWSATDGGAPGASVPLPQDDVYFTAASGSISVTFNMINLGKNIDFTGFTGTLTGSTGATQSGVAAGMGIYGNLTLGAGMTINATSRYTLRGRGAQTLRTNGVTIPANVSIYAFGGSYTLLDSLTLASTATLGLNNGTFDAAGFNVSAGLVSSSNAFTRTLTMGSGTWTLTGTGTVWNVGTTTGLTMTATSSTIVISDTSSALKTFSSGTAAAAYGTVTITPGGTGAIAFSGSDKTITTLNVSGAKTITFTAGAVYTITNLNITSTQRGVVSFRSNSQNTRYTISVASGTVGSRWMFIKDCNATGGATFISRSSYGENNVGWTVLPPRRSLLRSSATYSVASSSRAASGANTGISGDSDLTLFAYFRPTAISATRDIISIGSTSGSQAGVRLQVTSATAVSLLTTAVGSIPASNIPNMLNRWVSIACTKSAGASAYILYVDGVSVNGGNAGNGAFVNSPLFIGSEQTPTANFEGQIAFMGAWDEELTASEILMMHKFMMPLGSPSAFYVGSEGSGGTYTDVSGNGNNATLTNTSWSAGQCPYGARAQVSNRTPVAGVAATGTITVTDYQYLAGKASTATITVTDYTAMTGGTLDVLGFIIVTEGVDFNAVTSNNQTAINLAAAIDAAAGSSVTTVVGPAITISAPGSSDGGPLTWDTGGLTPTSTTFTGGYDITVLYFGSAFQPFQVAGGAGTIDPGLSNSQCASNIATAINGGDVTAVADGAVVTITYNTVGTVGNAWAMSQQAQSAGTISNGLTLSGATLSGGTNAIVSRTAATNRVQL